MSITRTPPGLLSLLDLKVGGQNPRELSDLVLPTLDVTELYATNSRFVGRFSGSKAAIGPSASDFTVPNDEIWILKAVSAHTATLGPGMSIGITPTINYRQTAGTSGFVYLDTTRDIYGPTDFAVTGWDGELILRPGEGIGISAYTLVAGPITYDSIIVYYALKI